MRQARKVLTVPSNGQISIGKQWAGREVMVEMVDDNRMVITAGTFIPHDLSAFYTKEAQAATWSSLRSALRASSGYESFATECL